jgi:hypothetical protein
VFGGEFVLNRGNFWPKRGVKLDGGSRKIGSSAGGGGSQITTAIGLRLPIVLDKSGVSVSGPSVYGWQDGVIQGRFNLALEYLIRHSRVCLHNLVECGRLGCVKPIPHVGVNRGVPPMAGDKSNSSSGVPPQGTEGGQ